MRAGAIVRKLVAGAAAAVLVSLGLASAASAAAPDQVTVSDVGGGQAFATIAMSDATSSVTLSAQGAGVRIHDDGNVLSLSATGTNPAGCTQDPAPPGDVVCTDDILGVDSIVTWTITDAVTPGAPLARDVLNAAGLVTTGTINIQTGQLMEAFLPNASTNAPKFTGDDTVAPAGQTADIVHVGAAGLAAPSNMGGGNDLVIGSTGAVNVNGGNGDDTLIGSSVADVIDGGAGNDLVRGGLGADTLSPGAGFADVLSYDDAGRGAPLVASFTSGVAFSPNPDGDTVAAGFEGLEGTPLADSLTSTGGAILRGAEGDDLLQGGPGIDTFDGGDGNDDIQAADGNAETVDCGAGLDITFSVDPSDTVLGCEGPPPPPAPAGAATVPTAGSTTTARPITTAPAPIGATLSSKFSLRGAATVVTTLTAKKLPAGSSLTITCTAPKGKSSACAFKTKTRSFKKATASSSLAALFKSRKLPAGTKIVVRMSAPGKAAKTFTFTTRKRKQPKLVAA